MGTRYIDVHSPDAILEDVNKDFDRLFMCSQFCQKREIITRCAQDCYKTKDSFQVECGACRTIIKIQWRLT